MDIDALIERLAQMAEDARALRAEIAATDSDTHTANESVGFGLGQISRGAAITARGLGRSEQFEAARGRRRATSLTS